VRRYRIYARRCEFMRDDVEVSKYRRSRYHLEDMSEKYGKGMRVLLRLCEGELKILEAPRKILKAKREIIISENLGINDYTKSP
jgi:hypothetical protein